jgi:N-formylglutamate amidohydrolase
MVEREPWMIERGEGPVAAFALHAGHDLRREVAELVRLTDAERLREEDPYTPDLMRSVQTRVVVNRSRFEVDLNRPRDAAVYLEPDQSWGLDVWSSRPPADVIARSLEEWDRFHAMVAELLGDMHDRHGRFVVYDVHSYNHRRAGPDGPVADASADPDVNVGTGSLDRARWAVVVDSFMTSMRTFGSPASPLDVRENIRFRGGHFSKWVHERFPDSGCVLAIEFKKTFMDEWTGHPDRARIAWLGQALASTIPGVVAELDRCRA